ncbi:hypothetical protein ACFE04_031249 [Oxalis oulophora]
MAEKEGDLKSISINGVKMYSLSSHQRSVATWIPPKKQRTLRKDKNYMERLELIQDLRLPNATSKIKATPDGEFLIASGIYPPQIKVYELRELAVKFERHLDSEIIDFHVLDDDYSKLAFLCADRSIVLHAKYGKHYRLRLPRMGRDMAYDSWTCDLLCAGSSPDLYRINLEQGRFLPSLTTQSPALNVVCRSNLHGLIACGGDDGAVECFDPRTKSAIGRIDAVSHAGDGNQEVTSLGFEDDCGYLLAVGSSAGKVLIYDLRSSHPVRVKDHMYGTPIIDIKWHRTLNSERPKLITTDNRIVRVWDPDTGDSMTSIEPTGGTINDICVFKNSGLLFLALDSSQIPSYFIPSLGPAPKWCASLENLTEELEEGGQTTIYDDYKFLTREDLERLNLTNLIGTNLLRAYMHGFFIDYRLYKKAQTIVDPFAYETYKEQQKEKKLEAARGHRITVKRKLPKVNRRLAASLAEDEALEEVNTEAEGIDKKKRNKKKKGVSNEDYKDNRFQGLFENKDYEIDENSKEYMALHPVAAQKQPSINEYFDPLEDEDEDLGLSSSEDELENKKSHPRLYEIKDGRHADAFRNNVSVRHEASLPLGERIAALQDDHHTSRFSKDVKVGPGGSREISFAPRSKAKYKEDSEDKESRQERRGVESIKFNNTGGGRGGFGGGRGGFGRGGRGGFGGGRGGFRGRGGGGGRGRGRGGSRGGRR